MNLLKEECMLKGSYTDHSNGLTHIKGDVNVLDLEDAGQQIIVHCPIEDCSAEIEMLRETSESENVSLSLNSIRTAAYVCKFRRR